MSRLGSFNRSCGSAEYYILIHAQNDQMSIVRAHRVAGIMHLVSWRSSAHRFYDIRCIAVAIGKFEHKQFHDLRAQCRHYAIGFLPPFLFACILTQDFRVHILIHWQYMWNGCPFILWRKTVNVHLTLAFSQPKLNNAFIFVLNYHQLIQTLSLSTLVVQNVHRMLNQFQ